MLQIGNFVSKISDFNPFLALAKNLTTSGRPNERTDKKSRGRPFDPFDKLRNRRLRDLN